jgi:hypothetical protein
MLPEATTKRAPDERLSSFSARSTGPVPSPLGQSHAIPRDQRDGSNWPARACLVLAGRAGTR